MIRDLIEPGERDVIALRLMTVAAEGRVVSQAPSPSLASLIRKRARLGAAGVAIGSIGSDGAHLHLTLQRVAALPAQADFSRPTAGIKDDTEGLLLKQLNDLWLRLSCPLLVTCGGRSFDLPFLRYRCLATASTMPALHFGGPKRFAYFDRYNLDWHIDLADFLAVHGASQPLTFYELCDLCEIPAVASTASLDQTAQYEADRLFALLARTLHVIGR